MSVWRTHLCALVASAGTQRAVSYVCVRRDSSSMKREPVVSVCYNHPAKRLVICLGLFTRAVAIKDNILYIQKNPTEQNVVTNVKNVNVLTSSVPFPRLLSSRPSPTDMACEQNRHGRDMRSDEFNIPSVCHTCRYLSLLYCEMTL